MLIGMAPIPFMAKMKVKVMLAMETGGWFYLVSATAGIFFFSLFCNVYLFILRERERACNRESTHRPVCTHMCKWGKCRERERGTERENPKQSPAVRAEPNKRLNPMNHEIMT